MLVVLGGCTGANLETGLGATGLAPATTLTAAAPDDVTLPPDAVPAGGAASVETAAAKAGADDSAVQSAGETPDAALALAAVNAVAIADTGTAASQTATSAATATNGVVPPASIPTVASAAKGADAGSSNARPFGFLALAPTETRREKRDAFRARAERASLVAPRETKSKTRERTRRIIKPRPTTSAGVLPGVRSRSSLFQIGRAKTNDSARSFRVASAAGLARLSGNGLRKQTAHVKTECFKPGLVAVLKRAEQHFGRPVMVTSGYRSPKGNSRAGGAKGSKHMSCEAADVQIEGVSKWTLAKFFRAMPGRGGVGTYCHTQSVHVDIGSERDWNWKCRKRK